LTAVKRGRRIGNRLPVMRASLRHRGSICGWLAAVLVAQLLLTAAHACAAPAVPVLPPTQAGLHLPGCHEQAAEPQDGAATLLCKAHCAAPQQSVSSNLPAADVPQAPFLSAPLLRVLDTATAEALAAEVPEAVSSGPPAGSPPLYLSLLVLRN
jgi:hypothetical protein